MKKKHVQFDRKIKEENLKNKKNNFNIKHIFCQKIKKNNCPIPNHI